MSGRLLHTSVDSPVGELLLVGDGSALRGIYMENGRRPRCEAWVSDPAPFEAAARELTEYFDGERTYFDLPLAFEGTPFQLAVWKAVGEIEYGGTCTYGELAGRIGRPGSARAVGSANAANPLSIVIPCHRLVGSAGELTGYSGGLEAKAELLGLEARGRKR